MEAPERGKLFQLLFPITSYLVTAMSSTFFWIWLFLFNRTTVIGKENVGDKRNTLLLSNHQTMIDSFLVGVAAFYPRALFKPHLMPWNPAAVENLYHRKFLGWLSDNWKCIPVREGRRDVGALTRMIEVLPRGTMTIFPEGTRSRDGSVRTGRPGPGFLVLSTGCRVIPVAIDGMHQVYPIGRFRPGFFKQVYVCFGEELDLSDLLDQERTKETAQAIVDRVMDRIRGMHAQITALRQQSE